MPVRCAQESTHTVRLDNKEFIALAQANPRAYNYGSGGTGSPLHVYAELFSKAAGVSLTHVPFKRGGGKSMTALMAGEIHLLFAAIPTALSMVKSGKVRTLAVTTSGKRLPSMQEAGLPGMTINAMYGLVGPAGMPRPVITRLRNEVVKALSVPGVKEHYAALDAERVGSTPEEYAALIRSEVRRWTEVIRVSGISIDAQTAR